MNNILEIIDKRYSVRTYSDKPVEQDKIDALKAYMKDNIQDPFGNRLRFALVDVGSDAADELKKLTTYGIITGCRLFIAGAAPKAKRSMEDFGYCMEKIILFATSLGLGTVWLGGTFNRSGFAQKIELQPDEVLPAISPIGYPAKKPTLMDRALRGMSGGNKRKDFEQLFFIGSPSVPLSKAECGKFGDVLEAVRWAPSASNKQPWRIIKEKDRDTYHFYLHENTAYNAMLKDIRMQNIDMGIAMCHFELSARQLGLDGAWQTVKPSMDAGDLIYITSWVG